MSLGERFGKDAGAPVEGRFGAVGAMKEALLGGAPCDVFIATAAMVDTLAAAGELRADTRADLGRVATGIAVRSGAPWPDIASEPALRQTLLRADALYFPDPERATAGIHFAGVLRRLGVHDALQPRFKTFPNGETAMRELSVAGSTASLGCTQVTEIRYTPGVELVGPLPRGFDLSTVYSAAVTARCTRPERAQGLIALLTGVESFEARAAGGFE
jgi:molybdate transport system substrate-binding protein